MLSVQTFQWNYEMEMGLEEGGLLVGSQLYVHINYESGAILMVSL